MSFVYYVSASKCQEEVMHIMPEVVMMPPGGGREDEKESSSQALVLHST